MKKKIINGILAAAILVAAPSAFVSCKDNDADLRTELLGKIADLRKQLDGIVAQKGDEGPQGPAGKDGSVVTIVDGYWYIDGQNTGVPTTGPKGDPGEKGEKGDPGENANVVEIGENGNWFINGKDTGIPAKGQDGKNGIDGKNGTSIITIGENGNWFIDGVDSGVPATGPAGADGKNGADGKDGVTPVLVEGDDGHYYWWIKGEYTGVRADGDGGTVINNDIWTISDQGTWVVNGTDTGILAYNYEQMVKLIKDQIYNAERDGLTPELEEQIKKLLNKLDNTLQKSIKDMITDVIVERTENSLYGMLAIPGWNPLVVSAYYGETKSMVFFPDDAINITNAEQVILDANEEIKGEGSKIIVTLNPAEASTSGKMLALETSQGKESPFTLGELAEYNEEITFGWNRTRASNNGLYEVSADLKDAKSAGLNIKTDLLKNDAQDVLDKLRKGEEKNAISSLAIFMADAFTDAIETVPAYTLKVNWNDPLFGPRSIRSGYNIAAFSINPLAFDFEYGLDLNAKGYIDRLQAFFDKVVEKTYLIYKNEAPAADFTKIRIEKIDPYNNQQITIKFPNDPQFGAFANQTVVINWGDPSSPYYYAELAKYINDAYTNIQDLNNDIDKINEFKSIGVINMKNQLKAEIHDYLSQLVTRINNVLGEISVNKIIQPTLLVKDSNGMHRATGEFSGEISLVPTSYSAELLAPAYKKFIVVTEVDGNPATAADNTGDLGKVLDGGVQQIKFTPAAGKSYTIAYSAMDYFGNIVTNYYVISGK